MAFINHMLSHRLSCGEIFRFSVITIDANVSYLDLLLEINQQIFDIYAPLFRTYEKPVIYLHVFQILLDILTLPQAKQTFQFTLFKRLCFVSGSQGFSLRNFFIRIMLFGKNVLIESVFRSKLLTAFVAFPGLSLLSNDLVLFILKLFESGRAEADVLAFNIVTMEVRFKVKLELLLSNNRNLTGSTVEVLGNRRMNLHQQLNIAYNHLLALSIQIYYQRFRTILLIIWHNNFSKNRQIFDDFFPIRRYNFFQKLFREMKKKTKA